MHVVVLGAGIVGASIAYHLAKRGADVTVIERGVPAGGATSKSFSWINAHHTDTQAYFDLRMASMDAHRDLEHELGAGLKLRWGGSISWEFEGAQLEAFAEAREAAGYPVRVIDRSEFARLEPQVVNLPEKALLAETEGALDPVAATETMLAGAAEHGARLLFGCEVLRLTREGAQITGVTASFGDLAADRIVVAAGSMAGGFLAEAGLHLPMDNRQGLIVHTRPVGPVLDHLILSPEIHFRQEADGRIIIGEDFGGRSVGDDPVALANQLTSHLRARLPSVEGLDVGAIMVGTRPEPVDGYPAVGAMHDAEGLYLASMHSGVTLAPIIGRLASEEILNGQSATLLEAFRPTRFNR